jgi:pterin-4a-carbinolamine dehydratase
MSKEESDGDHKNSAISGNDDDNTDINRIAERIKATLADLEKDVDDDDEEEEAILTRVGIDEDAGIIKIYTEKSDYLKKALSGLNEVLELAYTTAEHHPYWSVLYHATEVSKILLERWSEDLSKENLSDIAWRIDEMKMALERFDVMHQHHHEHD